MRGDGAHSHPGQRQSQGAARGRQHEALGQELPGQARLAGADRRADRDLALARLGPGQQQVGDVGARHQQQERDRAEDEQERLARGPPNLVFEGNRERLEPHLLRVNALARQVGRQALELRRRALRRGAPDERRRRVVPVVAVRQLLRVELFRNPDLRRLVGVHGEVGRESEASRHHADDVPGDAVELDHAVEDPGVAAVTALPEAVPENDDRRPAGQVLGL